MTGPAPLWWRDDDAIEDTPALRRLLDIKRRWDAPLALAVVPSRAGSSLTHMVTANGLDILVHGFAHANHAGPESRKSEFTRDRNLTQMRAELAHGLARLRETVRDVLPVFVPPWNRFPVEMLGELPAAGYAGLSSWGEERKWPGPGGLAIANAHIDLIEWRPLPKAKPVEALIRELTAAKNAAPLRPIGILTHHLQMDEEAFEVLEQLFREVSRAQSFFWTSARRIFPGVR
jgi:hypothetical protein